jgi:hypothetical protein
MWIQQASRDSETGGRFHSTSCSSRSAEGRSAKRLWYWPIHASHLATGVVKPK